ncbi:MAG: hypothetical protein JWO50_790, partial [Candidatus Kaiserbacteria bacterium]|nr:hypothetical protein [Candidatus Kaiserbacteria bacterium]
MKSFYVKIVKRINVTGTLSALILLLSPSLTFAVSYTPGQTLDPACLPTDSTCQVINTNVVAANFTA